MDVSHEIRSMVLQSGIVEQSHISSDLRVVGYECAVVSCTRRKKKETWKEKEHEKKRDRKRDGREKKEKR